MPPSSAEASVPAGYLGFCLRFADQCQNNLTAPQTVALVPTMWSQLVAVNNQINNAIWPEDDIRHYGRAEYWTIPSDGYGDCEDYALAKQRALVGAGLPQAALRLAIVFAPDGGRHAVLTVATDKGDYVLDNMAGEVLPWNQTPYVWIERQDETKNSGWAYLSTDEFRKPVLLAVASTGLQNSGEDILQGQAADPTSVTQR